MQKSSVLIKYDIKACWELEVQRHTFLVAAVDRRAYPYLHSKYCGSEKCPQFSLDSWVFDPQRQLGRCWL
jgi:hypothetical protein